MRHQNRPTIGSLYDGQSYFCTNLSCTSHSSGGFSPSAGIVLFLPMGVCIKASVFTRLAEASAMVFVAQNTSVPVPKVYSAFKHKQVTYIVMERVPGKMLCRGWRFRTAESQARVLASLRRVIQQLRQIPAPAGCGVSNVDGGQIYDPRLPGEKHWGPFRTVEDFHRKLRADLDEPINQGIPLPGFERLTAFHRQSSPDVVFTHGDLSSLNIMAKGDEVVGIIDWETAGWMPPYWEYTSSCNVNPYNEFWREEIDKLLEPLPEALDAETVRRQYNSDY